jgi:Tfp pilus assembly protein PilF
LACLAIPAVVIAVPVRANKRYEQKYQHMGNAWLALGRLDYAHLALERALRAKPTFLPALEDMTTLFLAAGQLEIAAQRVEAFRQHARKQRDAAAERRADELARTIEAARSTAEPR